MLLSNYAIKFRTAVFVVAAVLAVLGMYNYVSLPREGNPDITIPYVFVTAIYDGTAPSEIEKLVTIPLEKMFNDLENVKEIRSTSMESVCSVTIEFMAGQDIDQARQHVKDKVDLAKPDLPDDLDEPIVDAFNMGSDFPVYIFAISGDTDLERLKGLAENLSDDLELLSGVRQVDISGTREREIRVEIDLTRLIAYDVPLSTLISRIAQENTTVSAGNIEMAGDKFQVRLPGEFEMTRELRDILLVDRAGQPIYLSDVATVSDTYKDVQSISRLNGDHCVSVGIKKRSGVNAVALIDEARKIIDGIALPPGITITTVMDQSEYVDLMITELENNIATGFILVFVVLFIFMGARNSLFVGLAIPLSMLVAFTIMGFMGSTLNMMVLFSLVLAVGMLVDNAIVIVENIYRNRTLGLTKIESARRGASEVAWPVITSTLTTCAAFSPLLFWPGIMGQFMRYLPQTLMIVLVASLFVAMVINPAVCSALISRGRSDAKKRSAFVEWYARTLRSSISHRWPVMMLGIVFLVLSLRAYWLFGQGKEQFAEVEPRNAIIEVKFPQGTSIERTDSAIRMVEATVAGYEDVRFYLSTVGSAEAIGIWGGGGGVFTGRVHVEFKKASDRVGDTIELVATIRDALVPIAGAEITVEPERMGPPTGAPVMIELSGDDLDVLSDMASEIMRKIKTVPGLVDLQTDYEAALPELQFRVDRHRAALLGLDTDMIGLFLRTSIYGIETSKFRSDEDESDITLRLPESQRNSVNVLDQIFIPVPGRGTVPLSSLGSVTYTGGQGAISRCDRKRVITISGNDQGVGVDEILEEVSKRIEGVRFPQGYGIRFRGDTEQMEDSSRFLMKAFAVALALILVILVLQFNSVLLPTVILLSILLSLIGVMWGLLICVMKFSIVMTGVGVISLAGIVVNNAIVLVDCIQQRRADGLSASEAVVAAGRMRLRPVLLTAVTTILGLIPMALGYSLEIHQWPPRIVAGAETSSWWAPMAVAVIFGLGVSTVLTLVLIPVMYSLSDSFAAFLRRQFVSDDE